MAASESGGFALVSVRQTVVHLSYQIHHISFFRFALKSNFHLSKKIFKMLHRASKMIKNAVYFISYRYHDI